MRRAPGLFLLFLALAAPVHAESGDAEAIRRGAYIATLGDCAACHSVPGHPVFSGGYVLHSPFGDIVGTNITPDPQIGIGRYTLEDFDRVLRKGVTRDGRHLYPAMPYASYSAISDQDVRDLYQYFMHEVPPSKEHPPETKLPFPFNQRWAISMWNTLFLHHDRFTPNITRDAPWNRGAYLVQTLGHCGACHTPRGPAYEEKGYDDASSHYLTGEELEHWWASNLRGDSASGLGRWSEADIAAFLKTGHGGGAAAFGSMTQTVEHSTQAMEAVDIAAIAHYLKSLPPAGETTAYHPERRDLIAETKEWPGAGRYDSACASCHRKDGTGYRNEIPALAGNPNLMAENPASLIHIMLEGGQTPRTESGPPVHAMPAFDRWSDREIAEVVTYIRQRWGNDAPSVSESQVASLRAKLAKQTPSISPPSR